jgi:hypothetical protein
MDIPLFSQDLKSFVTSKSNWIGGLIIIGSTVAFAKGSISMNEWLLAVSNGSAILGIKDAIVKIGK